MKNSSNKAYLFINTSRILIVVINNSNQIIYKNEARVINPKSAFDLNFLNEFINTNIFKIEKVLNEFVKYINIIIDHHEIYSLEFSIKNKTDNIQLNYDYINKMLLEAKSCCNKTLENCYILHMKIDRFNVDDNFHETLPEKNKCKNISIDLGFICLPKNIIYNLEEVLKKYQISINKILSFNYLNNFLDAENDNLYLIAEKILNGYNQNEVIISNKIKKNVGFFEKFFNFFE